MRFTCSVGTTWEHTSSNSRESTSTCLTRLPRLVLSTFKDKNGLLTRVGKGSIAAKIMKDLLSSGAHIVITTSRYSRAAIEYYQRHPAEILQQGLHTHRYRLQSSILPRSSISGPISMAVWSVCPTSPKSRFASETIFRRKANFVAPSRRTTPPSSRERTASRPRVLQIVSATPRANCRFDFPALKLPESLHLTNVLG